jgi:hypothetical protein
MVDFLAEQQKARTLKRVEADRSVSPPGNEEYVKKISRNIINNEPMEYLVSSSRGSEGGSSERSRRGRSFCLREQEKVNRLYVPSWNAGIRLA